MAFDHIDTWVFDLDNTLYNADTHSFVEMGRRMTGFVARCLNLPEEEAARVRRDYYQRYGTTLRGLMTEHAVPPEEFLRHVHDFDLSPIAACAVTRDTLDRLPGRKIVFTNAPRDFAQRMLSHLGISRAIEGVFAVEDADYWPKPDMRAFDRFVANHGVTAASACMVEDMAVNLVPAHQLGMTTVWLHGDGEKTSHGHVHHVAQRLPDFFAHPYFIQPAPRKALP